MSLLSAGWDRILEARARRYAEGRIASERLPRPVVSVGNLTMGGTGKTPFVLLLAGRFLAEGRRPAILSRGYGRRSRDVVVVSSGEGPRVAPDEGGDEPVLLARRLPGSIVVVAPRRSDAARAALAFSPDVFLLDDGFQHLAVQRDANLLLVDVRDPFGGGYPPFGRRREPVSAAGRADAVVWTHREAGPPPESARAAIAQANPTAPEFHVRFFPEGFFEVAGAGAAVPAPAGAIVAVCGIARPESFRETLRDLGLTPAAFLEFPDHRSYDAADLERIGRAAKSAGATAIVTTEKDAVKLSNQLSLPLRAVRLGAEIAEPAFWSFLGDRLFPAGRLPGETAQRRES